MKTPKTLIIGLTGGIATGKSTVSKLFKRFKIPVIDADRIAHDLTKRNKPLTKKIFKIFGNSVIGKYKTLNRKALAQIVFSDPKAKKTLENLLHPQIKKITNQKIKAYQQKNHKIIVLDIPLLFEAGRDKDCDLTIVIAAKQNTQIKRLMQNRGMSKKDALARIKNQMPLSQKIKKADFILKNDSSKQALFDSVYTLLNILKTHKTKKN